MVIKSKNMYNKEKIKEIKMDYHDGTEEYEEKYERAYEAKIRADLLQDLTSRRVARSKKMLRVINYAQ